MLSNKAHLSWEQKTTDMLTGRNLTHDVQIVLGQHSGPTVDGFPRSIEDPPWEQTERESFNIRSVVIGWIKTPIMRGWGSIWKSIYFFIIKLIWWRCHTQSAHYAWDSWSRHGGLRWSSWWRLQVACFTRKSTISEGILVCIWYIEILSSAACAMWRLLGWPAQLLVFWVVARVF